MDRNLLLAFVLSFLVLLSWQRFVGEPAPPPEEAAVEAPSPEGAEVSGDAALPEAAAAEGRERFPELAVAEPAAPELPIRATREAPGGPPAERLEFDLPLSAVTLTSRGAALESWELKEYVDHAGARVVVVDGRDELGDVALTPFLPLGLGDLSQVDWPLLARDADQAVFGLERSGVRLTKTWSFDRDSYDFRLRLDLENGTSDPLSAAFLVDWPVQVRSDLDFREQSLAALVDGSVKQVPIAGLGSAGFLGFFTGRSGPDHYDYPGEVDWAGVQSTYFLAALFPDKPTEASARIAVLEPSHSGAMQLYFDPTQVPPGQSLTREYRGYVGPKDPRRLEALGSGAPKAIDLGWSWVSPLTHAFGWLLHAIYSLVPNYGLAIILLTIGVRVVTAPLTIRQMRSMERMRRVQPRMKEIQEKYADDRQKQSEEMMRLYRQEKVNPLGGCFPMVLQLPVFIGLFYALRSSILLRQAPFFGWIDDLSAPDELFTLPGIGIPLRVLPLVMGATMFVQQKITPMQTPDPAQARMMQTVMPVMMTVLFYQFPSGLVLYWMMSNLLAIGHQLWIGKRMQPQAS